MRKTLECLVRRENLHEEEAAKLLVALTDESLPNEMAGALLTALRIKGETAEEVRGFAAAMRRLARRPKIPDGVAAVDIVGTGGDGSGSLNLSTGAALLTAACGQPVVKHGNRAISSKCGSADVLEALGIELPADEFAAELLGYSPSEIAADTQVKGPEASRRRCLLPQAVPRKLSGCVGTHQRRRLTNPFHH